MRDPFARPAVGSGTRGAARNGATLPSVLAGLLVVLAALAVYLGGLQGEFLGADHALFSRSPLVSVPTTANAHGGSLPGWLPQATTTLSLAADRLLWGPLPAGLRTTNIALHLLCTLLLFIVALRVVRRLVPATAAALLFAVHPLHVEAVEIVGARAEILATLFALLCLLLLDLARGADEVPADPGRLRELAGPISGDLSAQGARARIAFPRAGTRRPLTFAAALVCCLLATFSSGTALALPLVVVLADVCRYPRLRAAVRRHGTEWALFAGAALPALAISLALAPPVPPLNRWLAGRAVLASMRLLLVPYPLASFRFLGPAAGADALSLLALLAALLLFTALYFLCRKVDAVAVSLDTPASAPSAQAPVPAPPSPLLGSTALIAHGPGFGLRLSPLRAAIRRWTFLDRVALMPPYCGPLLLAALPVLALAVFPPAPPAPDVPFALLERRLYLPSAGACLLLAALLDAAATWLLAARQSRTRAIAVGLAATALAAVFTLITLSRHPVFKNDAAFYADAAARGPRSAHLAIALARAASARGRPDQAIEVLKPLIEQRPADASLHLLLGNLLRDARALDAAETSVREALRLDPSLAAAHVTLGLIARERGNLAAAEAAYRQAILVNPDLAEAHQNLGALLAFRGSPLEALDEMKRAVALDPTLGDAAANLASFLLDQKQPDEALATLRQGLRYSEANPRLHYNLGVVLQRQGDERGATSAYLRAIQFDPTYARPKNNLATLYVEEKKYDEAIVLLRQLVELEPANERAHYNLGIALRSKGDTRLAAAEFAAALRIRPDYREASRALSDLVNPAAPAR